MQKTCEKTVSETAASGPVLSKATWMQLAILGLAFLLALWGPLALLVDTWSYMDFSHGIIVPVVSLYIIWAEREKLRKIEVSPGYFSGITVLIIGAVVLMLGRTAGVALVEQTSIIVIIPGLVLLLLGTGFFKAMALPLGYLILMVPVLNPLIDKVHWPFQLITARFASAVLPYLGVPVYQDVQFLHLPNISLEVAEACSGANFMVSVIALAIPLAYFALKEFWRRALLMVMAFFIGLFTNGLRVTLVGVWTYYDLGDAVHGPYHLLQGYFVSIFGFIFLFATASIIRSLPPKHVEKEPRSEAAESPGRVADSRKRFTFAWAAALVVLTSIGMGYNFYSPSPVPLKKPLNEFPMNAGQWTGTRSGYTPDDLRVPGATDEFKAIYRSGAGRPVRLYIGYLDSQTQGREIIGTHFSMLYEGMSEVQVPDSGSMSVNRTVVKQGGREFLVLFWHNVSDRTIVNRYSAKLATAIDGLVSRKTNGAFIMVSTELQNSDDLQEAFSYEADLIKELNPALRTFFQR